MKSLLTCAITENHRTGVSKEYRSEGREPRHFQEMNQPRQKNIILIIFNYFLENQTGFKLKPFSFKWL